jgi:signal transduction histidine kinase
VRLADFILANVEPILEQWETFARSIWPSGATAKVVEVRDDAEDLLREIAIDMRSEQTGVERADKSNGRAAPGFDLEAVIAEHRALRTSVLRLWRESDPTADLRDMDDVTRFNESIDQSLADAVRSHVQQVERDRALALASEQASRKEAEAASRGNDMFLALLSHEMRTPLNAIGLWLSILRQENVDEKHRQEGLDVIERNTRAQVQLIDDVLDLSRIASGKLHMNIGACELADVITAGVNAVRPAAEARGITINVQLDPSASDALCDRVRIQQVVSNLVSNAVKFTAKGGRVDVTLSREQSSTQIQVSDDGQGISAELLPLVFDRFRQADSSTRRRLSGLGLALSVVKHVVEAHGGTVEATSPGEGKGSTFTVRLPTRAARNSEDA